MIEILYTTKAVGLGIQTQFSPAGGAAPYTFSVDPSPTNPQGTINSQGLYTASRKTGTDRIILTDSLNATAELFVSVLPTLELFCDVIRTEMGLDPDQVYIYNQKISPIVDSRLYIAVGINSDKYFGNTNKFEPTIAGMDEVQTVNCMSNLSLDIVSRNDDARNRRSEIVLALNSKYSQNQQELNSFNIGKIPGVFTNLSKEEGAAIPFRFNINVNVQYFEKKVRPVAYFDVFQGLEIEINK